MLLSATLLGTWLPGFAAGYPPPPGDYPVDDTEVIAPYAPVPHGTAGTSSRMLPFSDREEDAYGPYDGATLFGSGRPAAQTRPPEPIRGSTPPAPPAYPRQPPAFAGSDRPGAVPLAPAPGTPASPAAERPQFRPPALDPGY